MYMRAPRHAFSLVELIVVIAVIAILIAVLLPSLSGARSNSRYVVCKTNLRSIGQLLQSYVQENDNRVPRGPSHTIVEPIGAPKRDFYLTDMSVATNMMWLGNEFFDQQANRRDAQLVGLGLLTGSQNKRGNELFFCPDDDTRQPNVEGMKIGKPGEHAYSSYLYRQVDMIMREIEMQGKLDDLKYTDCTFLLDSEGVHVNFNVNVEAMAMDYNSAVSNSAFGQRFRGRNHEGKRANVVYRDGSVRGYENSIQIVDSSMEVSWATIPSFAYDSYLSDKGEAVKWQLDRIFVAADYSFHADAPWQAPIPNLPVEE